MLPSEEAPPVQKERKSSYAKTAIKPSGCPERLVDPHPCRHPRSGDGAVSTDGAVGVPVHCREWDAMAFKGPFQFKLFYDPMVSVYLLC